MGEYKSDKDLKRLKKIRLFFALAKEQNIPPLVAKEKAKKYLKLESFSQINEEQLAEIIELISERK